MRSTRGSSRARRALHAILAGSLVVPSTAVFAEEGGSGHYLPGSMASFVDGVPPVETFITRYNFAYYGGNVDARQALPIAGLSAIGAEATTYAHGLTLLWRPPVDLGEK